MIELLSRSIIQEHGYQYIRLLKQYSANQAHWVNEFGTQVQYQRFAWLCR